MRTGIGADLTPRLLKAKALPWQRRGCKRVGRGAVERTRDGPGSGSREAAGQGQDHGGEYGLLGGLLQALVGQAGEETRSCCSVG